MLLWCVTLKYEHGNNSTSSASVPATAEMQAELVHCVTFSSSTCVSASKRLLLLWRQTNMGPLLYYIMSTEELVILDRGSCDSISSGMEGLLPTHTERIAHALVKYTVIGGINNLWLVQCVHIHMNN